MRFITNCINADGQDINDMKQGHQMIVRRTFLRHVDRASLQTVEKELGYDRDFPMSKDWHVAYYKSTYQGKPCIYFVWSAIEYVFVA